MKTFECGLNLVLLIDAKDKDEAIETLRSFLAINGEDSDEIPDDCFDIDEVIEQ